MEKKELFEQEMNKKYGQFSVKDFTDRFRELGQWLDGYLNMIYPSLDEEVRHCVFQ